MEPHHGPANVKILLLSSNTATSPYPVYPLGMSAIAAALKHAGHETVLYDLLVGGESMDAWRQTLRAQKPGLVGISIRNLDNVNLLNEKQYTKDVGQLVRCVHEELDVPVVLGGSGYSLLPEAILRRTDADYGIAGEGETRIVELVASLERGQAPPTGTIFRSTCFLDGQRLGRGVLRSGYSQELSRPGHDRAGADQARLPAPLRLLLLSGARRLLAPLPAG